MSHAQSMDQIHRRGNTSLDRFLDPIEGFFPFEESTTCYGTHWENSRRNEQSNGGQSNKSNDQLSRGKYGLNSIDDTDV